MTREPKTSQSLERRLILELPVATPHGERQEEKPLERRVIEIEL